MEAAGHFEEIIVDTLAELGLKKGGIVGLKHGGRIGYRYGDKVAQTAASEDAPFNQQRVLLEDLDTSGGVSSIFGGPSELEEAEYESGKLDDQYQRSEIRLALAKQIKEENPDWSTKEVWNEIRKITKELYPHLFNKGGNVGLKHGGQLVKRGPGRPGYGGVRFSKSIKEEYKNNVEEGYKGSIEDYIIEFYGEEFLDPAMAQGGRINKEGGGVASVLPKGREADYRGGGVIPVGSRERADDVPARLSKNEFVMTADAVRAAGGGSINKGAKRMYNLMHNLEARV